MMKSLLKPVNNLKFRTKLMISYCIFIIIPLGLMSFFSYNQVSKTIESLVLYSAKQNFEQTYSFLNYKMGKIIDISDIIAVDQNLTEILMKPLENYSYTEQIRDAQDLTSFVTPFENEEDVYRIRLYVQDSVIYSQELVNLFSMSDIEGSEWYRLLVSGKDKILWCPGYYFASDSNENASVISAARMIRDPNDYSDTIGIFRIDMLESNLKDIVRKANTTQSGVAYLQNSDGLVITSSDQELMKSFDVESSFSQNLAGSADNWQETHREGDRLLVGSKAIIGTDWFLVSIIPYEEILSTGNTIRQQMLVLLVALTTLAYILAFYMSGSNTKRISRLIKKMRKVQEGELEPIKVTPVKDEIGELMETFNYMIHRIKILIEEQYKSGQEIKSVELKALQAQINPHFLYNTLDLINWTAIKHKVPELSSLVQSLSKFYKLSLNKGRDIVPISDEIQHVTLYTDIQNRRFENKIHLSIDVDDDILEYSILKTILQPIAENSIMHGILEKDDQSGNISIRGRLEKNTVILEVQDDGIGIDIETVNDVLNANPKESHGYGVRNINNRLKLHYGQEYGLTYTSKPGKGTEVVIRIPAIKINESELV
ncbi:MAG: sensor histidine kinase [Clostridiaceae bacterium]|nr:sensor histidine kinase [Clostridiaceae bacterium]